MIRRGEDTERRPCEDSRGSDSGGGHGGSDLDSSPEGGEMWSNSRFFPSRFIFVNVYILLKCFINTDSRCILKIVPPDWMWDVGYEIKDSTRRFSAWAGLRCRRAPQLRRRRAEALASVCCLTFHLCPSLCTALGHPTPHLSAPRREARPQPSSGKAA